MTTLHDFFELNYELVIFAYGLVFFVLGLAIALQSRQRSRLQLARSLGWLSLFGITHGLHEWGIIFIPIQSAYMDPAGIAILHIIQVTLLSISFVALFTFGADLLWARWPRLKWFTFLLSGLWGAWFLGLALVTAPDVTLWQRQASIWGRYLLALPGALLAAYGLRYQAVRQIKPLGLQHIYTTLQVAGLALVAYAFFAGVLVPEATFFPANRLNEDLLFHNFGVPVYVFRSLIGLVLTVAIVRAMEVFEVETDRLIEQMRIEQSLAAERERIGRELHDGAIQMAYTAGLIIESARQRVDDDSVVAQRLERAMTALNEAISSLRAYMTGLREEPAGSSLAEALRQQAENPRFTTLLTVELDNRLPEDVGLHPAQISHIQAIVGEALANAARHAGASRMTITAGLEPGQLVLQLRDNGVGFNVGSDGSGYGLRNMRDRARLLGGELRIDSARGRGTTITLALPWDKR